MNKIKYAKRAGILYLLITVISPIAILYIPSIIMSGSNAVNITQNLINNETLFRIGIGIETIICLLEIILSVILYKIFKEGNSTLSLIAFAARLSMTIIQAINIIASLTAVGLLRSSLITGEGLNLIILTLLKYKEFGVFIWQILFGLHLIILGYLVYKSSYVSKIFGILLALGSLGYLAESYFEIYSLDSYFFILIASGLLMISTLGEVAFMLRLLIKKINLPIKTENK